MARLVDGARLGRVLALVFASTLALTASFVGLVALARGEVRGTPERLPIYATAAATAFVAGIVAFEEAGHRGRRALLGATLAGSATLFVTGFGGEGLVYALERPAAVFEVQLLGYLLSASLMGTGVGYWALRNLDSLREGGLSDAL